MLVGLVFAADTRTNAGVDNVSQFRKLHFWRRTGDRVFVLLTSGNLAITQSVVSLINEQIYAEPGEEADPAGIGVNFMIDQHFEEIDAEFALTEGGVFFTETDQDGRARSPLWVCSRLAVVARTRDADGDAWGYLLEFDDPTGKPRTWAMPARLLAGDGAEQAALAAIRNLALSHPTILVGVGSIYDAVAARRLIAAGARFIVSPITDPETGIACREAGVGWLPGAFTPTEIALAERSGASFVKLFPALAIDAPAFLRSVLAPNPNAKIVPTNVALEEIAPLAAAGAAGFGVGARLLGEGASDDAAAIADRLRAARCRGRRCRTAGSTDRRSPWWRRGRRGDRCRRSGFRWWRRCRSR